MEHQQSYQGQGQGPDGTPGGPGGAPDLQTLGAGAGIGLPPQMHQQLPAQMFTTAAQLLDLTDKKLMISLRDGRKLIGVLRSWDQFANIVLQSTIERIFVAPSTSSSPSPNGSPQQTPGLYADIPRGLFLVRGENVLLLGEIDLDKDDDAPPGYERAEVELVQRLKGEERSREKVKERRRWERLAELGFEGENEGEVVLG